MIKDWKYFMEIDYINTQGKMFQTFDGLTELKVITLCFSLSEFPKDIETLRKALYQFEFRLHLHQNRGHGFSEYQLPIKEEGEKNTRLNQEHIEDAAEKYTEDIFVDRKFKCLSRIEWEVKLAHTRELIVCRTRLAFYNSEEYKEMKDDKN